MHHIYREKPEVWHHFEATLHLLVLLSLCFDPFFLHQLFLILNLTQEVWHQKALIYILKADLYVVLLKFCVTTEISCDVTKLEQSY